MRLLCALAALTGLLLAGCAQPPAPPAPECADPAACPATPQEAAGQGAAKTQDSDVYTFEGVVIGANPPDLVTNAGPAAPAPVPVAKRDTFKVPDGALDLSFSSEVGPGSGVGEVYIYGPDGDLVHRSGDSICAGIPSSPAVCAAATGSSPGKVAPGEYVVVYGVAGALRAKVAVVATLPVAAQE